MMKELTEDVSWRRDGSLLKKKEEFFGVNRFFDLRVLIWFFISMKTLISLNKFKWEQIKELSKKIMFFL